MFSAFTCAGLCDASTSCSVADPADLSGPFYEVISKSPVRHVELSCGDCSPDRARKCECVVTMVPWSCHVGQDFMDITS